MSQKEVASVIGATQQHYSKIENGLSDISGERLIRLAKFYKVSADYLLSLTDTP